MADLGSKSTDGSLSFTKYVTNNNRFQDVEFEIEKGKKSFLFIKKNKTYVLSDKEYASGTKLKILDKDYIEFDKVKLVNVKIKN
jgi:sporulation protein YlmC with PRC-barrel domain